MICSRLKSEENEIFNFHRTVCELQVKIFAIWDPGIKKSELRIPGKILGNFPGIKKAPAVYTPTTAIDCTTLVLNWTHSRQRKKSSHGSGFMDME